MMLQQRQQHRLLQRRAPVLHHAPGRPLRLRVVARARKQNKQQQQAAIDQQQQQQQPLHETAQHVLQHARGAWQQARGAVVQLQQTVVPTAAHWARQHVPPGLGGGAAGSPAAQVLVAALGVAAAGSVLWQLLRGWGSGPSALSPEASALLDSGAAAAFAEQARASAVLADAADAGHQRQLKAGAAAPAAPAAAVQDAGLAGAAQQPQAVVRVVVPAGAVAAVARCLQEQQAVVAACISPQVADLLAAVQEQQAELTEAVLEQRRFVASALQVRAAGCVGGAVAHRRGRDCHWLAC